MDVTESTLGSNTYFCCSTYFIKIPLNARFALEPILNNNNNNIITYRQHQQEEEDDDEEERGST